MMQFLKSILSRSDRDVELREKIDSIQQDLDSAIANIENLNNAIKTLAHSYATLTQEVMCVSDIIQQAASMAKQSEYDVLSLQGDPDDDGGYLN